jgi:hypothetical protein
MRKKKTHRKKKKKPHGLEAAAADGQWRADNEP